MGCQKYPYVANAAGKIRRRRASKGVRVLTLVQRDDQDLSQDLVLDDVEIHGFNSTDVQNRLRALGYGY